MAIRYLDEPTQSKITYLDETPPQMGFQANDQAKRKAMVEEKISNRPSFIDVNNPINFDSMKKHPFGESLRALGGGFEVAEGVPADIGLGFQDAVRTKGESVKNIPGDMWKTLTGKRPAQFGDIYRASNAPILSDENLGGTGVSVPAVGGFLSASHPATPTGGLGNIIGEGISKTVTPMVKAARPAIGKVLSGLSGIPEKSMKTALENPEVLSSKYLKNEAKTAGEQYKKVIKPLVNDQNAVIGTGSEVANLSKDLNLYTPTGASTATLSSMNNGEQKAITDWLQRLDNGSGHVDFNEADKIVKEIDRDLNPMYRAAEKGSARPTDVFERTAKKIRDVAGNARKQFSGAGETIDRYSALKQGEKANKDFNKLFPDHTIYRGIMDALIGHFKPEVGVGLGIAGSPIAQKMAIKGASALGNLTSKNGALLINAIRAMKNQSS